MKDTTQKKAEIVANGEESRQAYALALDAAAEARKKRRKQAPVPNTPPGVEGIIDASDNTLDSRVLGAPLKVTIPVWDNLPTDPAETQTVVLQWAFGEAPVDEGEYREIGRMPVRDNTPFPITQLSVPVSEIRGDGHYSLRYVVIFPNATTVPSEPVGLIVDTKAPRWPNNPEMLVFPVSEITDDYLTSIGQVLKGKLPDYPDWQLRDRYAVYIDRDLPTDFLHLRPVDSGDTIKNGQEVKIQAADLRALGDGTIYAGYLLVDKAFNESKISYIARLEGAFGKMPSGFQPPVVPLAPGGADTLIDLKDAFMGVTVDIPTFNDHKQTDFVQVTWGTQVLAREEIGSRGLPMSIVVPSAALLADWNGAIAEKPVEVSYQVFRGNVPAGSAKTSVNVDFTYVGPGPGGEWPDPVNPKLLPPTVTGKSGTAPDNELNRDDEGLDATLTFPLYDPALKDEQVTFYWGGCAGDRGHLHSARY